MEEEKRVIHAHLEKEHYKTNVTVKGHNLIADEPEALGGKDLGMSPFDLLASGLATCTAITLRMYADRKAWPLDAVDVSVDHRQEMQEVDGKKVNKDVFTRRIELNGALDAEQKQRLMLIADKCPVHKCLSQGAEVETEPLG